MRIQTSISRHNLFLFQMHVVIAELGRYPLPAEASGKFVDDDDNAADDDDDDEESDVSDASEGADAEKAAEMRRRLKAERRQFRRRQTAARSMGDLIADMAGRRLSANIEEDEEEEDEALGAAGGDTRGKLMLMYYYAIKSSRAPSNVHIL